MKTKITIIAIVLISIIIFSGWSTYESKTSKSIPVEKYAIMRPASSSSYEYKLDLGSSAEYSVKSKTINSALGNIVNEIDALDYVLKQGFILYTCIPEDDKIIYILKEAK